jgi:hypothetical protein
MLYVQTCNDDRRTPVSEVMWILETSKRVTVHLNFRSEEHVSMTGVEEWLNDQGWGLNADLQSTVSTGIPNGPYAGPVYSRTCDPGRIELMGSNTWEGVYFVFVEILSEHRPPPVQRESRRIRRRRSV